MESRTQGSRPKPRTHKSRGQGHTFWGQGLECSRPRTKNTTRVLQKQKKNVFTQKFAKLSKNSGVKNFFLQDLWCAPRWNKKLMTLSHFQQVKKLCCPRAEDKAFSRTCRNRGQELDLRGQGQRLQIVSLKTSTRPRVFSRTPPLFKTFSTAGCWLTLK